LNFILYLHKVKVFSGLSRCGIESKVFAQQMTLGRNTKLFIPRFVLFLI
jgi:hypothetical protein